ncbi:cell wall hydrolase [Rhizobium sp. Root1220]|uniref:cell wall hydrolase n=1 Tax=Rhizobium sp. Root1220 TaxID=1736432 RepID=UPI0006FC803D|nr:cell wall hydrolase [Rhizobium sp. Root1220]KQV66172.1 hydrolase [Rhizobium sp. Root1220]
MRAQKALGRPLSGILLAGLAAASCTTAPQTTQTAAVHSAKRIEATKVTYNYTSEDRSCLKRAMYFESEHSDHDGYMAVGTVVMNRLTSGAYPDSICGIVAQQRQFAPGVMTREVKAEAEADLDAAADAILHGQRNPAVKEAMFFHTDGLKFPYNNMHYVAVAGGNAFYEKRGPDGELQTPSPLAAYEVAMNYLPQHSASSAQFELLVPVAVPVPIPMPLPDAVVDTDFELPGTVAVPSPRPPFDSAALRGGFDETGG